MKEFKLTMEKARENLGDELFSEITHPKNSLDYKMHTTYIPIALITLLIIMLFDLPTMGTKIFATILLITVTIMQYYDGIKNINERITTCTAKRLKILVADPELLWLNKQEHLAKIPTRYGRIGGKPLLDETDYKILEYLKKNKTSQGMHTIITSFKNSNSVNTRLKRMAQRGLVKKIVGDYEYEPWTFKIFEDTSQSAKNVETTLNKSWEYIIDDTKNKKTALIEIDIH